MLHECVCTRRIAVSLGTIACLSALPTTAFAAPAYNPTTSDDLRTATACALLQDKDALARLTVPQDRARIPYRDAAGNPNEKPLLSSAAFADLGGDGKEEALTFISGLYVPRRATPVFVYQDGYPTLNLSQYGMSNDFGFLANGLELTRIAIDDLNGDGIDDVVFIDYGEHDYQTYGSIQGGNIAVALSSGRNGKYSYSDIAAPRNIYHDGVTVDIDRDGDKDIVAVGPSLPNGKNKPWMVVMLNDGAGHFTFSPTLSLSAVETWAVSASDIDHDGVADLLLGQSYNPAYGKDGPKLSVYWDSDLKSKPTTLRIKTGSGATRIGYGDVDMDGSSEILFNASEGDGRQAGISVVKVAGRNLSLDHAVTGKLVGRDLDVCNGQVYGYMTEISKFYPIPLR